MQDLKAGVETDVQGREGTVKMLSWWLGVGKVTKLEVSFRLPQVIMGGVWTSTEKLS